MELNFAFYLSLVLAAFACTGLLLAGRGHWYGWAIGLAAQPFWATYAIVTEGYGLLITCVMYGGVNTWNLWKWWKQRKLSNSAIRLFDEGMIGADKLREEVLRKVNMPLKGPPGNASISPPEPPEGYHYFSYDYPYYVPCPNVECPSYGANLRTRDGIPSDYQCMVCKTIVPLKRPAFKEDGSDGLPNNRKS